MITRGSRPFNQSIVHPSDDEMSGKLQPRTNTGVADAPTSAVASKRSVISPAKKMQYTKLKKNPRAPKRFKSAFIIFSAEKHKEIRAAAVAKDPTAQVWYNGDLFCFPNGYAISLVRSFFLIFVIPLTLPRRKNFFQFRHD